MGRLFKRKIYDDLLVWKEKHTGKNALLIEGARRIGKSTIVEEFAKNEYDSYVLINFDDCRKDILEAFENNLIDLDEFFARLQYIYNVKLIKRHSLIIFDEVQHFPKARQSIKKLVADGRYDYIETGSLISIRENVQGITIPSEEISIKMYPLDFEEFIWALDKSNILGFINESFIERKPLDKHLHMDAMELIKKYILIGGMPQVIKEYIDNDLSFEYCDLRKRAILDLYRKDIMKIKSMYREKVLALFDLIPAFLSKHEKRVIFSKIEKGLNTENTYENTILWLQEAMMVNNCFKCNDPNVGLALNKEASYVKCYMGDTGLLFSECFDEGIIQKENLYMKILQDKLSINKGMLYENVIAQMLVAKGYMLYFWTHYDELKKRNDIEIDFLISKTNETKKWLMPIEAKSSKNYTCDSIKKFTEKYNKRISESIIIHNKNMSIKDGIFCIPPYMTMCL